eukprot:TRINITY_DN38950_c0_g1_i1.p1 TRINITY_DN38950_c0_g1~~TRINITY_DN38950_c0_g1_i1.p1  ORF type:complete len:133 (+),score=13.10 TRINITY_DN38950_c0_g1_i1:35-433(+)
MPRRTGLLKVEIVEAQDLRNADSGKKGDYSDPFCRANCNISDDGVQQTRCIQDNLNPVWNDTVVFELNGPLSEGVLEVWILDKDRFSDDDLGRVLIPMDNFRAKPQRDEWYELTLDNGNKKGRVHLKIAFKA